MVKHYQDANFAWVDYSATSLVLSVLVLPGALFSSVCSLKTSLRKLALPCLTVSIIALEVSRNVLVLESPLV